MLDTQVNGVASLSGTFLFLTTVTVLLRFLARYKQKAYVSMDDYLIVCGWIGFVGIAALSYYGIGQKFIGYKQPKNVALINAQHPTVERVYLSIDALGVWTFGTAKLSALFFYRRIFCSAGGRDIFHYMTVIFIAIVAAWIVTFFVMTFNLCGHHSINWDVAPGHSALCKLDYPYFEATTISDFILDVFILTMPLPKIWSLHATTSRKVAISGVFLLALVGLAASTARMVIFIHIVRNGRAINDEDGYQSNTQMAYYAILEAGFTIVTVNLPSLWYFVAGVTPESVVRSVRSIVSLGSGRGSNGSNNGASKTSVHHTTREPAAGRSLDTNSSRSNLTKNGVESYAMTDMGVPPPIRNVENGIRIERNFQRTEEQV